MAVKKAVKKATKKATSKKTVAKKAVVKKLASKQTVANKTATRKVAAAPSSDAAQRISKRIADLDDWRGDRLAQIRALIHEADPDVVEEWKWETPVWSHDGLVCTGESYKQVVKLTFAKGASLPDPKGLFNSSLEGNVRRAIDIQAQDRLDAAAFRALFRAAVAHNRAHPPKRSR